MNTTLDPKEAELATAVKRTLLELQAYHHSNPLDDVLGRNVEALVACGALSAQTADFILCRHAKFYGFYSSGLDSRTLVIEVELPDRSPPVRCFGFADGRVEWVTGTREGDAPAKKQAAMPVVLKVDFQS